MGTRESTVGAPQRMRLVAALALAVALAPHPGRALADESAPVGSASPRQTTCNTGDSQWTYDAAVELFVFSSRVSCGSVYNFVEAKVAIFNSDGTKLVGPPPASCTTCFSRQATGSISPAQVDDGVYFVRAFGTVRINTATYTGVHVSCFAVQDTTVIRLLPGCLPS